MTVRTFLDTVDISADILSKAGIKIDVRIEDNDGKQSITGADFRVSNLRDQVDSFLGITTRTPVFVRADNTLIFDGFTSPSEGEFDKDGKIYSVSVIHREADIIENWKRTSFLDGASFPGNQIINRNIFADSLNQTAVNRRFASLNTVFSLIASRLNIGWDDEPSFAGFFVGGTPQGSNLAPVFGGRTHYEFINEFANLFNCVWRYNSLTNKLEVRPRVILTIPGISDLSLTALKDTPRLSVGSVGFDSVRVQYSNGPDNDSIFITNQLENQILANTKIKTGFNVTKKIVSSQVSCPRLQNTSLIFPPAQILLADQDNGTYLIRSTGQLTGENTCLRAKDLVDKFHNIDLLGTDRVSGQYEISDISDTDLQLLSNAFYTKFTGPEEFGQHFITKVTIDWQQRTAIITGVKYANTG